MLTPLLASPSERNDVWEYLWLNVRGISKYTPLQGRGVGERVILNRGHE